jgi:hypothetical protein
MLRIPHYLDNWLADGGRVVTDNDNGLAIFFAKVTVKLPKTHYFILIGVTLQ